MTVRRAKQRPGFGVLFGLFLAWLLFPGEAWADLYAPFVWPVAFSAVGLLPLISVAEGLILWKLRGLPAWRALKVAFLVNAVSTLLGVLLSLFLAPFPVPLLDILLVAVFFAGTVGFEGLLLARFARSLARPYSLSLRMNLVSYAVLLACAGYLARMQADEKRTQREAAQIAAFMRVPVAPPPEADAGLPP